VSSLQDYVEDGNKQLEEAQEHQKSSRKKIFCIACSLAIIIGLIIAVYYITK
jgi:flagellar biogenesis protein FliO